MIRYGLVVFGALLALATANSVAAEKVELRVGIYQNPPKLFLDSNGRPDGFYPGLLNAIFDRDQVDLTFVPCTWRECLVLLETGQIDVMPNTLWTPERARKFTFGSEAALQTWSSIYTRNPTTAYTLDQVLTCRISVLDGSAQHRRLLTEMDERGITPQIVPAESHAQALEFASKGASDFAIANTFFGVTRFQDLGLTELPIVFMPATAYFAFRPDYPREDVAIFDKWLSDLKARSDSNYYALLREWLSVPDRSIPNWVWLVAPVLVVGLPASVLVNSVLHRMVAVRTRELEIALSAAESANQAKTSFLANMSHELRTPLNAMMGFSECLTDRSMAERSDTVVKYASYIHESSGHLLSLINDLLLVSDIERGRTVLDIKPAAARSVIAEALRGIRPLLQDKHLKLKCRAGHQVGLMMVDARAMHQCLLNLLSNAIQHSPVGGLLEISVTASRDGYCEVSIVDEGPGMSVELIEQISRPNYEPSDAFIANGGNAGIGLYLTKKLLTEMNGSLDFSNREDRGLRVSALVPRRVAQ